MDKHEMVTVQFADGHTEQLPGKPTDTFQQKMQAGVNWLMDSEREAEMQKKMFQDHEELERWQHAACLSIAKGAPGWSMPTANDSEAMKAVRNLRKMYEPAQERCRISENKQYAGEPQQVSVRYVPAGTTFQTVPGPAIVQEFAAETLTVTNNIFDGNPDIKIVNSTAPAAEALTGIGVQALQKGYEVQYNVGEIDDVEYFKKKLMTTLTIPAAAPVECTPRFVEYKAAEFYQNGLLGVWNQQLEALNQQTVVVSDPNCQKDIWEKVEPDPDFQKMLNELEADSKAVEARRLKDEDETHIGPAALPGGLM